MNDERLTEASKAIFTFLHTDRSRYGALQKEIEKNVDLRMDSYPTTIEEVY